MYSSPETCAQGHRSTIVLPTSEGGSICLLCLSNLLSNPRSPTVHVSYALSQLSQAISQPQFLHSLLTYHSHFLISPLVDVISSFDDEPLAKQTIDLVRTLCDSDSDLQDVRKEFVTRVSDWLSGRSLAWSHRQLYMLHCFGVLLDNQDCYLCNCIKDKDALILNLVTGLQVPNDEIQGEIMFVLYRTSLLLYTYIDDTGCDLLRNYCPKLLRISLDILMKSQSDDVRLNCLALLMVLAQRGFLQRGCSNYVGGTNSVEGDNFMLVTECLIDEPQMEVLFAEAVKGPLLSSDDQVQIATLDLIFSYLSSEDVSEKEYQVFIEENIGDYIFEILRLSGSKDAIVNSSIKVLDLLSNVEQAFRRRLVIGFSTLVPILRYVAEIPFQPVQRQVLKLILDCVLNCPGIVSTCSGGEISSILAGMFKKHLTGEIGMLPETFTLSCSILVALMKCSSSRGNSNLVESVKDAASSLVSTFVNNDLSTTDQILHSLYLLKEAYAYDSEDNFPGSSNPGLRFLVIDILKWKISPWFMTVINDVEEEVIPMGVIETMQSILINSNADAKDLAEHLVSSSWFSILLGCLGLYPSEKMKWRVYLCFSSIVGILLGDDSGEPIRDAVLHLPSDPIDLLFLLGQKSCRNLELFCCQNAVLMVLYISTLYNDRIADEKLVLSSLEQFILLNNSNFPHGPSGSVTIEVLANLYGFYRGFAKMSYQIPYSSEAERILFQLLAEKDWDSLSTKIHMTSLTWLFQQEKLCKSLSNQILKFCRCNSSIGDTAVVNHSSRKVDLNLFAELITSGNNFGAMIFVCLLGDLVENDSEEYDIISVLNVGTKIIEIVPVASDKFCVNGIDCALQSIYNHSSQSSPELFIVTCQFVFSLVRSVQPESLTSNEAWVGVTVKLMDYLSTTVASDGWTDEVLITLAILSFILHHSTSDRLIEASKIILLSAPLGSIINSTISEACSKGHALVDHDEGTRTGEVLIFLLALLFFSLRSIQAVLPGIIDFRIWLDEDSDIMQKQSSSYPSIQSRDLCKLMHFGSAPIKLTASFCLMELFASISGYTENELVGLNVTQDYLLSVSAILEGLIFFGDTRVALNCSLCLSTLISWKQPKIGESSGPAGEDGKWGRFIVEELVMSLCAPSLTSKSSLDHHKPAAIAAASLLKLSRVPSWMTQVFDESSIGRIIQNLCPSNLNAELVVLFRELLKLGYLNSAHVAELSRTFQACRTHVYVDDTRDSRIEDHVENDVAVSLNHVGKARAILVSLMSSASCSEHSVRKKELLEEIELFSKCLMEEEQA